MSKDGGPAFPRSCGEYTNGDEGYYNTAHSGMSLREWFAGQVLNAIMSNAELLNHIGLTSKKESKQELAEMCYNLAEAMVKEKEKRDGNECA